MSKTLFNTNTFNNKNVKNSDDVADLKVTTFKATNAILTNPFYRHYKYFYKWRCDRWKLNIYR